MQAAAVRSTFQTHHTAVASVLRASSRVAPRAAASRWLASSSGGVPPGPDPLELLRKTSEERNLCDAGGFRRPGMHWSFSVAVCPLDGDGADLSPNLRTVGFQRVTPSGIDFVMKNERSSLLLTNQHPVSFLYTVGRYKAGETAEQWRAEGHCEHLPLGDVIDKVPHYTIVGMVASRRAWKEGRVTSSREGGASKGRMIMENQSHFVELIQTTRIELENGDITNEEIEDSLVASRFQPHRVERMVGGPDHVMWDRWEWLRSKEGGGTNTPPPWNKPAHLIPY